jgi:hypothetical protein
MGEAKIEVFLTDDDASLKSALSEIYAGTPQLLYIWHVNKHMETSAGRSIMTVMKKRQDFMANWK